jgi:hypothetical protein
MLGSLLPGGSPLKPPTHKPEPLNGMHPRRASTGSEAGLGGGNGGAGLFGGAQPSHLPPAAQRQALSFAAAAAWAPRSPHSSLDSGGGREGGLAPPAGGSSELGPAASAASSSSDALLQSLPRYAASKGEAGWQRCAVPPPPIGWPFVGMHALRAERRYVCPKRAVLPQPRAGF